MEFRIFQTFVVLCLIGICVAASVISTPIEIASDDLTVAESANPQFGARRFGRRHRYRGGYGGKLYAETTFF